MQSKLTLSIEQEVIEQAKEYAKQQGISLSKYVQEFLKKNAKPKRKEFELPENLKDVYGAFKLPDGLTAEEARLEYLMKKHG